MNASFDQTKKIFLIGSIALGALIVAGLAWAIVTGVRDGGSSSSGVVEFHDDNDPIFGPAEATSVVRIFGDFQCPACRTAEPSFQYAKATYGKLVKFIWNDFPLQALHPNALAAANAARCAEAQGKFWEYHDTLYTQQSEWADLPSPSDKFIGYAGSLSLNLDEFKKCVSDRAYQNKIIDDLKEGEKNSVAGTPTYFIRNKRFSGFMTNQQWDQEIQTSLRQP